MPNRNHKQARKEPQGGSSRFRPYAHEHRNHQVYKFGKRAAPGEHIHHHVDGAERKVRQYDGAKLLLEKRPKGLLFGVWGEKTRRQEEQGHTVLKRKRIQRAGRFPHMADIDGRNTKEFQRVHPIVAHLLRWSGLYSFQMDCLLLLLGILCAAVPQDRPAFERPFCF